MTGRTWPRLMAIVDADAAARSGWAPIDVAMACVAGGATVIQIRAKNMSSGALLETVRTIVGAVRPRARVIVNDRADVARLAGADGVHVGQEDLAPGDVRRIVGPEALIGWSTHTPAQLAAAVREAARADVALDYAAIGPVFDTGTKQTGYQALGLERVRAAASELAPHGIPLVAIGGITLANAPDAVRAGATAVAVIGDLLATGDPARRVREYIECLTI